MADSCKVFVVSPDLDTLQMLSLIVEMDVGCQAEGASSSDPAVFERIRSYAPDLVMIDFVPYDPGDEWGLLDRLRTDEATSSIPALALATAEPVAEQSLASYNVRDALMKPFDLDDLMKAIKGILSRPRAMVPPIPERAGAEALRRAANVLAGDARQIVTNWLQRVNQVEPFRSQKRLQPRQLIDAIPVLLWGTVVALRTGEYARLFGEKGAFRSAAAEHAGLRRRQGVDLGSLIREYELLRVTIWQQLWNRASEQGWSGDDVFRIGEVIHLALDEIVSIAADVYSEPKAQEPAA